MFLRDTFGNIIDLTGYDPDKEDGLKASIYPSEVGRAPYLIDKFYPITQADGSIILMARMILTEAGYYRLRLVLFDRIELQCSGKFFKVVPIPDVFTDVMVHDFTHVFSSSGAALLRDEDRPQISLYFTDVYGNRQD